MQSNPTPGRKAAHSSKAAHAALYGMAWNGMAWNGMHGRPL
jgi:hypothetical protein